MESRYSDEDSEIKNILGSGHRDSRYVIKSDEESPRKSKCRKIPVLDTSESEFEESELSRAGFSNLAFDEKESKSIRSISFSFVRNSGVYSGLLHTQDGNPVFHSVASHLLSLSLIHI